MYQMGQKQNLLWKKDFLLLYLPTGIGVENQPVPPDQSETSSSDAEIKTILSNPYLFLFTIFEFALAICGLWCYYNSNSTINKSGHLSQIIGDASDFTTTIAI